MAFSTTATCLQVLLKYPKVPFNKPFPTPSIFTREEVTWESLCRSAWKRSAHGTAQMTALTACTPPRLSHRWSPAPLEKLLIQNPICLLYFGSCVTNFSTVHNSIFF